MSASSTVSFRRDIPVRHDVDILVAGGGPAGLAAAVTAARQGRSVFLAEGHTSFGGMGTAGLVPAFMPFGDGVNFLAGGFGREVHDRLLAAKGVGPEDKGGPSASIGIQAEVLKRLYDEMVTETGLGFAFQTQIIGIEVDGGRVTAAVCAGKSGLFAVRAKVFIDGTGDGDLAAWAGAPFEKGDADGHMMPGTLCSLWADVDWATVRCSRVDKQQALDAAFRDKVFTSADRHLPGMWCVGDCIGGGNIGHTFGVDATDERSLTQALLWGRKSMVEFERFYKNYMKGYERMTLVATGSLLGVRETRRIIGDYVLNLEDFKRRAVFDDEIGRYSYPVDIHPTRPDQESYARFLDEWQNLRYGKGENYGIPWRSLLARGLANVLVAGRCISTDRYMQGSIRVMPGCYITGQAAGLGAALAAEHGVDVRGVDVAELQRRLKRLGAFLPNCK